MSLTDIYHGQNGAQHFELPAQTTLVAMFGHCISVDTGVFLVDCIWMQYYLQWNYSHGTQAQCISFYNPFRCWRLRCAIHLTSWLCDSFPYLDGGHKSVCNDCLRQTTVVTKRLHEFPFSSVMVSCDVICGACFACVWKLPIYNADSFPF